MSRRVLLAAAAIALTFSSLVTTAFADNPTGLIPESAEDYAKVPSFKANEEVIVVQDKDGAVAMETRKLPKAAGARLPEVIDLSRYLPAPGRQQFQDCVGWAVARGAVNYQVAYSRFRRKPVDDYDRFSPAYIYNQINNGEDKGSSILAALELLKERGCASEATMPYSKEKNAWSRKPPTNAGIEAGNYKAIMYYRVDTLQDIKVCLSRNIPVILSIQVDKHFDQWSGSGVHEWEGGTPLGWHAICVVGYNTRRKALRLMNSWGASWGDKGYVWVAESDLANINSKGTWCRQAWAVQMIEPNIPRTKMLNKRRFTLLPDGAIFEGEKSLAREGTARTIATTNEWLYWLSPKRTAHVLNRNIGQAGTWEALECITDRRFPQGLNGSDVTMIAATPEHLFALTSAGKIYERFPGVDDARIWKERPLPGRAKAVDLREGSNSVKVTTEQGKIYVWTGSDWED